MAEAEKILEFIPERKNEDGAWERVEEFIWRVPPEEMAVAYAALCIRKRCLKEAEANLTNYIHPEPMKIGGKVKTIEFHSAEKSLKKPFFTSGHAEPGTDAALDEVKTKIPTQSQWRLKKEMGLEVIASIGWLGDITKAKPPAITKDTSAVDYEESLLPENLKVREDAAPSGYNKRQVELLTEAKTITTKALEKCGALGTRLADMQIVPFGELLFKTQSRIFGALPDPETEEREKFEEMRKMAAAKAAEDDD